jgi:hypothetical protein
VGGQRDLSEVPRLTSHASRLDGRGGPVGSDIDLREKRRHLRLVETWSVGWLNDRVRPVEIEIDVRKKRRCLRLVEA